MTKSKHTPGPWFIPKYGDIDEAEINFTHPNGKTYTIAKAFSGLGGNDFKEQHANAHLIAAAPDLLEALEEIAQGMGAYNVDPLEHANNVIEEAKSIARAAIAKAKGDSQ